jgi:quercetin dioxygenase-like cupin family protein
MTQREAWNQKNPPTEASIVKNLKTTELISRPYRGTKARFYRLGGAIRLQPHLSELPPGHTSVKHRHTTEAVLYIVSGKGYTTVGYDGEPEQRIDWEEGDLLGIPLWAWHQHFNSSAAETARYLAVQDTFTIKQLGLHQIERHPDSPVGEE